MKFYLKNAGWGLLGLGLTLLLFDFLLDNSFFILLIGAVFVVASYIVK